MPILINLLPINLALSHYNTGLQIDLHQRYSVLYVDLMREFSIISLSNPNQIDWIAKLRVSSGRKATGLK